MIHLNIEGRRRTIVVPTAYVMPRRAVRGDHEHSLGETQLEAVTAILRRVPRLRALYALAFAAFTFGAAAQEPPSPGTAADGAAIYQRRCSVCHGEQGNGQSRATRSLALPPRDFTAEESRLRLTRQYMIAVVRDGRPSTPMVGRKTILTQAEIEAVVDFIRTAFLAPEPGSTRAEGYSIYRKTCAGCHGERGRGITTGSAHASMHAPLRAGGSTPKLSEVAKAVQREPHGRGMVRLPLSESEIQAVAEYVSTAFIERSAESSRSAAPGDMGH